MGRHGGTGRGGPSWEDGRGRQGRRYGEKQLNVMVICEAAWKTNRVEASLIIYI